MKWQDYKVDELPDIEWNKVKVETFTITQNSASRENVLAAFSFTGGGGHRSPLKAGKYKRLFIDGALVMSDTPAEICEHYPLFRAAHGTVLIHGLGLGMCLRGCLENPKVTHVTVVEKHGDVIKCVGEYWKKKYGDRLTIIHDDALTRKWPRGTRFNCVWHDIWTDICTDNLPEYAKLARSWARRCDWQDSWMKDMLQHYGRQGY